MSKEKLQKLDSNGKKSGWIENVLFRKKNQKWLNYSSQIARRLLAKIEDDKDLTQAEIARRLNVSAQHVSKIVKGEENLTLETIANLSTAIGCELITFPDFKYSSVANKYSGTTISNFTSVKSDSLIGAGNVYYMSDFKKLPTSNQSLVANL